MKQVTTLIGFFLVFILMNPAFSQKQPIDLHKLDQWEWFTERRISNDGKWVSFGTAPVNSRQTVLRLREMHTGRSYSFTGAYNARFSTDSKYFTCTLPASKPSFPDTTIVMQLTSGQMVKLAGISSFTWPEASSEVSAWVVGTKDKQQLKVTKNSEELLVTSLGVQQHKLLPDGTGVFYSMKDSSGFHLLFSDLVNVRTDTLIKGKMNFGTLSYDTANGSLVLPMTDSVKTILVLYNHRAKKLMNLPLESKLTDTGYVITSQTKVQFLKDKHQFLYSTQYAYKMRSSPALAGVAHVEVWSTSDRQLYTKQKRVVQRELNKPYYFSYDIKTGKQVQLTTIHVDEWQLPEVSVGDYALVTTTQPYEAQTQWDPVVRRDAYLVNRLTGERTLIVKNKAAEFKFSPYGHYIVWFDREQQHYFTYSLKIGAIQQIDKGVTDRLADRSLNLPQAPDPFGLAIWEANDQSVLINTNSDIWKVSPECKWPAQNLTAGYAKKEDLRFSFYGHWGQRPYYSSTDTLLFYAQNRRTKEAGFFAVQTGIKQAPSKLIFGRYSFVFPCMAMAGSSRQILLSFGNNDQYGLFYTTDLKRFDTLYSLNPHKKDYNWYKTELVRWQVSKGVYTEGVLYKPENFDPQKKYPLIIWMYENGHAKNINDYVLPQWSASFINYAFYASNGYVVFVPDIPYRIGQPGESAYNAVMTGVNHLQKQGWLDTARMGLQSHSWGGYEVAYILTRTTRFKAASAGAVVANMTSAYGGIRTNYAGESRQWVYEKHQSRLGASLWEKPELYIKNSPLFSADKISTPLLLMHNEQDGGVSFAQAIEFFSALKRLNRKAWLLNYPDENHVLNNPVNKKDFTYRLFQYFEHYLKGQSAAAWMQRGIPALEEGYTKGY